VLIHAHLNGSGGLLVPSRHSWLAELPGHFSQHHVGLVVHGVGTQVFALVNIYRLHPARVSLLAPVEKR
jgi:hypothetical protein